MTTFEQWRSPSNRLTSVKAGRKPNKYDLRVVDQFYAYCQAVSTTDAYREESARSQRDARHNFWTMLASAGFLFYYLAERVAQAMGLY